ncbi:hypothetical protein E8E14_009351 [Neopestalotiopsis sp. 37M]|nr:hypothetical protein E8E14_009351 [Neopestalotiopsis sp. 37M]
MAGSVEQISRIAELAAKGNGDAIIPQTHYTISEDVTSVDLRHKFYAISEKKDFADSTPNRETLDGDPRYGPTIPPHPGLRQPKNMSAVLPSAPGLRARTLNRSMKTSDLGKEVLGSHVYTPQIVEQPATQQSSQSYGGIAGDIEDNLQETQSESISVNLMKQLIRRIEELEATNAQLQGQEDVKTQRQDLSIQVLHTIIQEVDSKDDSSSTSEDIGRVNVQYRPQATYLSVPQWDVQNGHASMRGRNHVPDPLGYLRRKGDVSFVIYKCYVTEYQREEAEEAIRNKEALPEPAPTFQDFMLVSEEMIEAAKALFDQDTGFRNEFPLLNERKRMQAPFLWWYHYRRKLDINHLRPRHRELIKQLILWLESTFGSFYDHIDAQFRKGFVSSVSFEYLIRPGTVLVYNDGNSSQGYLVKSHPQFSDTLEQPNEEDQQRKITSSWDVSASSLTYNGELTWQDTLIMVRLVAGTEHEDVPITNLSHIPLDQSSAGVIRQLEARGKQKLWRTRRGQLVSYEPDARETKSVSTFGRAKTQARGYKPKDGQNPEFPELYLFPSETKGFNFRTKKWSTLEVDRIREVDWNNKAFGSLVADDDTKEMIQALVSNQLAAHKGTDLIESKGNGLILLLHGPPGTGKTYTAESVAEIARKPLYPVTCGDIGTEPEAVEKYLDSVFHLGKIWDCVVLLDEAEVFLEQRTLNDLKRNALVSVFLRTLEYYEGILILTTNRVGTFDEAFKSRISLALRYEKLTQVQRKQVWWNFIRRLEDLGEQDSVDLENLKLHIDELASYPMNGRQIRNSISTARQLALYKKTRMTSTHLRRSITLANKFDDYLGEVRMGEMSNAEEAKKDGTLTDEYFAREDNLR